MKSGIIPLLLSASVLALFTGCLPQKKSDKLTVAAGLPPVAGIVSAIGGDRVNVISILPQGRTPHDFAPRTATIKEVSGAAVLFSTGMPFENKVADFVKKQNRKVCDVSAGIERIAFHDGGNHDHHHHDGCTHDDHDPHVWLSPKNAEIIAGNVLHELVLLDPANESYYRENYNKLCSKLTELDKETSRKLAPYKGRTFFVYHPAFGYFAHAYGLKQRAIELNGREATPAQLAQITKEAQAENISTIFVQEQFNPGSAQALARQINGVAVPLDPLAQDVCENFKKIAESLETGFNTGKK